MPALHSRQAVDALAPSEAEYLPGRQPEQLEAPALAEYWPATQLTQTDESEAPTTTAVEALPAAHSAQETAPEDGE